MSFATADELFDVVDSQDLVISQAPRGRVHAQNLLHRAIHVIIHNDGGKIFLQRRSMTKDTFPGCWDSSCSGHVDAGEDYVTAARRELGEELGWRDQSLPMRPLLKLPASLATGQEFIQIFILGPLSGPFELHPDEISEGRWIVPAELDTMIAENPAQMGGALRLLWSQHRAEILAAIS